MRRALAGLTLLLAVAPVLEAQNSVYGVLGLGFPSRSIGVRARALGGGNAAVDPGSAVNPAAVAAFRALTVGAASIQEFRQFTLGGAETTGLEQTRFPYAAVGGRLGTLPLSFSFGFTQFAERTFDVATTDTVILRGAPVVVNDHVAAAGGVIDLRAALAMQVSPRVQLGIGAHLLSGSSKVTITREFSDSAYRSFRELVDAENTGLGVSAGVLVMPATGVRVGASARLNSRLDRSVGGVAADHIALPVTLAAGAEVEAGPVVLFAASVAWHSWGGAAADVASTGQAFDTWEAGAGVEVGGARGGPWLPLRLGVRYATLPFSPTADQAHELNLSAGTAIAMAANRVRFDFAVERAIRDGGGVSERAWQFTMGFQMVP